MTVVPLLEVTDLRTHLHLRRGVVRAVDGISLRIEQADALGLVGKSGCGKTMTSLSLLRLLPKGSGAVMQGSIRLDGQEITAALGSRNGARNSRRKRIAMIAQDPMTSLNPVFSIGDQVGAPFRYHGLARGRGALRDKAAEVLRHVRLPSPEQRLHDYPHQFSGGQRQRIVTAMAIACYAAPVDGRRADHRARCHHPGTDHRTAAPHPAGERRRHHPDHPRPRRRRQPVSCASR